jgi:indolepyruvate ferredoxin oxidoreductase
MRTGFIDATRLATRLLGDSIASNLFLLGYAFQKGFIPIGIEALDQAIELNNVSVAANRKAFAWGRLAAHNPAALPRSVEPVVLQQDESGLEWLIRDREGRLEAYQNAAYAKRYRALVDRAVMADKAVKCSGKFAEAVARNFYKLMAYKDEYEVARLYTDGTFLKKLNEQFEGDFKLSFHLAPPLLASRNENGQLTKATYGPWVMPLFRLLARAKGLRGTRLDIFGYTEERRAERALITRYETIVTHVADRLIADNYATAVKIADIPDGIRGYGHIKQAGMEAAARAEAELLNTFNASGSGRAAA